jgi:hypothetical protein
MCRVILYAARRQLRNINFFRSQVRCQAGTFPVMENQTVIIHPGDVADA